MDPNFMERLQRTRDICDFPFDIDSGWRCFEHNKAIGGGKNSYHLKGRAADIAAITLFHRRKIFQAAVKSGFKGFGLGKNFMHLDNRNFPQYWFYGADGKPVYITVMQMMKMLA